MNKTILMTLGLSLLCGFNAVGCGDDDDEDDVVVDAPGVDVKAEGLNGSAAGAAATD